jgi:hypothetical protein
MARGRRACMGGGGCKRRGTIVGRWSTPFGSVCEVGSVCGLGGVCGVFK